MQKTAVSAVSLSDIFAARVRSMHPLSRVTGFHVKARGGGAWFALRFLEPMPDEMRLDALALLEAMQTEFLLTD